MNLVNNQISGQNRNEVRRLVWVTRRDPNLNPYLFWCQLAKRIDDKIEAQILSNIKDTVG